MPNPNTSAPNNGAYNFNASDPQINGREANTLRYQRKSVAELANKFEREVASQQANVGQAMPFNYMAGPENAVRPVSFRGGSASAGNIAQAAPGTAPRTSDLTPQTPPYLFAQQSQPSFAQFNSAPSLDIQIAASPESAPFMPTAAANYQTHPQVAATVNYQPEPQPQAAFGISYQQQPLPPAAPYGNQPYEFMNNLNQQPVTYVNSGSASNMMQLQGQFGAQMQPVDFQMCVNR